MLYFYTFLSDFGENSKQRLIILSEIWGRLTWSGPAGFPDMDRAAGETGVTKSLINETDVIADLISFENI